MNRFLPSRYLEFVQTGAVALQLWDGALGARLRDRIDAVVEREDPLEPQWNADQRPGFSHDADGEGRFRFPKRRLDLHAVSYGRQVKGRPKRAFEVRLFDEAGRYAPRRLRVPVPPATDPDDTGAPRLRIRRAALYPGPAYGVVTGATGARMRVTRGGQPVRWARAIIPAGGTAPPLAVAHGDEKGELLLLVPPSATLTFTDVGTFQLKVIVGLPPPIGPALEAAIKKDRLADVPLEPIGAAVAGPTPPIGPPAEDPDPWAMGWTFPGIYTAQPSRLVTFTAGRIHRERLDF